MKRVCLIVLIAFFVGDLAAKNLEVCSSCAYKTLAQAVRQAADHDEIFIKKGIYHVSKLVVEKPLTIRGEAGTVLDGDGQTILFLHHDSITVSNIELRNVETNYVEDRAAIKCNNSDFLVLRNINIYHSFFGILVEKCDNGLIDNCNIIGDADVQNYLESSNGNAIHLWYCKNMTITNNTVKKHRDGIYFEFVENSQITANHSEANMRYGLHFMFSHSNDYHKNVFYRNGAGVAVMYSHNVSMSKNLFLDNWGESAYGLLLKDIQDSELENNIFRNNTIAISMDNTVRMVFKNNRFEKNGYAFRVMGNCTENEITLNDFLENSFDVTTNSKTNYNTFDGNFWEEYTGYDLDHDGIGDIPFRPVKLFSYITTQAPASIILMRSTFIDMLNLIEKITPVITPENLIDSAPKINHINDRLNLDI